jgi:small subunit ribosomal protein S8
MMTDPIADMLTRIRNAARARKKTTDMPLSKLKLAIAEILKTEGYLEQIDVDKTSAQPKLVLTLKYDGRDSVIHDITRQSKPGYRMYRSADELPTVVNGYGVAILSTSQGLMTNKEARKKGIGGEIICSVY